MKLAVDEGNYRRRNYLRRLLSTTVFIDKGNYRLKQRWNENQVFVVLCYRCTVRVVRIFGTVDIQI